MAVREPDPDGAIAIAERAVENGCPIFAARLLNVVKDLQDETEILRGEVRRLYGKAYLTVRVPKFLRRKVKR